jgi:preflagellin peptidase FlaK
MFNFTFFIFLITILFLIFASFFDIKKRIIPNKLVFLLFIIGLITKVLEAIILHQSSIFLNALLGFIITLVVSYIFWEVGFFAGGDLKLFAAISILNPVNINFINWIFTFGTIKAPIFGITLILVSVLATAPVLLINSFYLFIFKKHYLILWNLLKTKNTILSLISSILVLYLISSFFNIFSLNVPLVLYFILSILFILFFKQVEKYSLRYYYYLISLFYVFLLIISFFVTAQIFYLKDFISILLTIIILFLAITMYQIISTKILATTKTLAQLKDGDVPVNCYYLVNSKLVVKKISFITYLKMIINNTYHTNLIVDSRKIGGLSLKDITFLKSSYNHNLETEIILKKTIPFTPSVLCAYILLNILGDFIWLLF